MHLPTEGEANGTAQSTTTPATPTQTALIAPPGVPPAESLSLDLMSLPNMESTESGEVSVNATNQEEGADGEGEGEGTTPALITASADEVPPSSTANNDEDLDDEDFSDIKVIRIIKKKK